MVEILLHRVPDDSRRENLSRYLYNVETGAQRRASSDADPDKIVGILPAENEYEGLVGKKPK